MAPIMLRLGIASLMINKFPSAWKNGCVTLLLKRQELDCTDIENYRAIHVHYPMSWRHLHSVVHSHVLAMLAGLSKF